MLKSSLIFVCMLTSGFGFAQRQNPVKWTFSSKKINPSTYEVHLTAKIDGGWHLYSQATPDGGPLPTVISFTKNPLLTMQGFTRELGKVEQKMEPLFNVQVIQYSNNVDFVQFVKLKKAVKTTISGTVEFMTCDDHQCLPPAKQKFSIALK